jgi:UDP-arabinose 4-epimerase
MSKTVFVTGGAGYVGSHCCKAFAKAGWDVVVFDNLSRGWREFVKWGPLIEGDVRNEGTLTKALVETQPDVVAHFAALAYVGESVTDPARYYSTNTAGTLNVLNAMRSAGVESILSSSTCATYGVPGRVPITEDHPQSPINPYGWSKLFAEKMLRDFGSAYGIRSVVLRYFNAAGADPDGEIGERHEPETHLIPLAIRSALAEDYQLTIHGDDFDTPDRTCVRDYVHVADLADGHVRAVGYLMSGGASGAFNLGAGQGTSVLEVVQAVEAATGRSVKRRIGPRRPGDPAMLVSSTERARERLDWIPKYSDIGTILRDAVRWHVADASHGVKR